MNVHGSIIRTNIMRLEFIKSNSHNHRGDVERPHGELAPERHALVWQVVDDDGLEADVGVDEDAGAEESVRGRVEGAGGEGGDG